MIPHGMNASTALSLATLYMKGEQVILRDENGSVIPTNRALIARGPFGSSHEGVEALPRAGVLNANDEVVVPGDLLLVSFIDGNRRRPIILGAVGRVNHDAFLNSTLDEVTDRGRVRVRIEPRSDSNEMTGRIDVRAGEKGEGSLDVRTTARVVLRVGDDTEGDDFTEITIEGGEVTVKADAVRLADPTAQQALALATLVDARVTTLQTKHDSHLHPIAGVMPGVGAVTSSVPASPIGPLASVAAEKVFGV